MPRGKPFQPGHDPRRHQLTHDERSRGFAAFLAKAMPARLRASIRQKIKKDLKGKPNKLARQRMEAYLRLYKAALGG